MTVTSTVLHTATRIATQRATILIAQVETSTAVSTVDVTVSSAATQTDVIWVTATAVAKSERAVAFEPLQPNGKHHNVASSGPLEITSQPVPVRKGLQHGLGKVTRIPRQAAEGPAPTITEYVTETFDITSVSSIIITASTTSTVVTTVYQTNTRSVPTHRHFHPLTIQLTLLCPAASSTPKQPSP